MGEVINSLHTFHIPVMGTGYTVESPIKVAQYGIDSVVPITDHYMMEQVREMYCKESGLEYEAEDLSNSDARSNVIRKYLDLMHDIVTEKFELLRNSEFTEGSEITKYFELLPDNNKLKQLYNEMLVTNGDEQLHLQESLRKLMKAGSIDVNIMTKLDGVNYDSNNEQLPIEYNDAHAALKGFAESKVNGSVVLSAGLNPRLYGFISQFDDFFPNEKGELKKRIILKVSDYRSAMVQGRFLAKKGLWVSEFRIESGLNCGGHAFATDGYLLGPILKEFNDNRDKLSEMLFSAYTDVLEKEKGIILEKEYPLYFTVQGGVGDADEHKMFLEHYNMKSVGWGSPFMLVPEATTVDDYTLNLLKNGTEEDFYLSNISPLGVRFNSIKGNSADIEKMKRFEEGKPGVPCLKKFLQFNTEFSKKPICTASVTYQKKKIEELKASIVNPSELKAKIEKVVEKACLCMGLGNTILEHYNLEIAKGNHGVVVCPGPNLAYFNKITSLREMVDFIYGKTTTLFNSKRPNVFIKELNIYIDYLKEKIDECKDEFSTPDIKYFNTFRKNLQDGIVYYKELFSRGDELFSNMKNSVLTDLAKYKSELESIFIPETV